MKLVTAPPIFQPLNLLIETQEELNLIRALIGSVDGDIQDAFHLSREDQTKLSDAFFDMEPYVTAYPDITASIV